MANFGAGLAGFMSGIAGGMALGQQYKKADEEYQIAEVRKQGIAEARAMQAAAAPKVADNGDMNNLTSNPQMSRDPNAAAPVNTSLHQFQNNVQAQGDGGPVGVPVASPQVQDANKLSNTPMASAAPGAPAAPEAPSPFANGLPQTERKRFNVDGAEFDTQEEAAAHVKKSTPKLASFFKDTLIPKMTDALIAQGKPEQAAAWQKYADEDQTRTNMATWGKAIRLAQFGDYSSSAQELMKLHPHFDDGMELVKAEPTTGPDGKEGFTMTVRGEDGKEQQVYHDARTITEVGLAQLSPIEMFNKRFTRQNAADTLHAKEAIDLRNDKRTADRILGATKLREEGQNTRTDKKIEATKEQTETKIAATKDRDAERAKGKEAQIRLASELREKLVDKQGNFRKGVAPEEREAIIVTAMARDPMFGMLSEPEKKAKVAEMMALIPKPKSAQGAKTVPNPVVDPKAQGIQASPAPAGKKAVPVFNPATNKVEIAYR